MGSRLVRALAMLGLLACVVPSSPEEREIAAPAAPPGHCDEVLPSVSPELLVRPVALRDDAGRVHQAVTTSSKEAQVYYDQGLAYQTSYVWIEAARSYHEALRRDPDLAMAHLGLAKVLWNLGALPGSRGEVGRAKQLAARAGVTEKERRWIALFEQQLDAVSAPPAESEARHAAYKRAVEELVALDPDDPHAWVLRGNAEEPGAWGRGQRGGVGSIAFYEVALRRDPDHLGAHHFLVHSYENVGRYEEAAAHGRIYAGAAPGVPHAQHMLGHVLPRLGLWEEARRQFEEADRLERAYYESQGIAPAEDWHHGHNLSVLGTVALRLGDEPAAERRFREAYALDSELPNCAPWVEYLLLRGRNEAALEAAAACEARGSTFDRLVGASLAAEALLGLGRTEDARAALSRADAAAGAALAEARGTPLAGFGARLVRHRQIAAALVALQGDDPELGERELLLAADEIASARSIDGWASGLYRLVRFAELARAMGRPALAVALEERLREVDPGAARAGVLPDARALRRALRSRRGRGGRRAPRRRGRVSRAAPPPCAGRGSGSARSGPRRRGRA